jgi:hypothetical protein
MSYQNVITIESGKRGGRAHASAISASPSPMFWDAWPRACRMPRFSRIPELTEDDIRACLEYAADRERQLVTAAK